MSDKKEKVGFVQTIKNFFGNIGKYLKEVKSEMKKIVWPTKSQIKINSITVIGVSLTAALFVYGFDTILGMLLRLIYQNV